MGGGQEGGGIPVNYARLESPFRIGRLVKFSSGFTRPFIELHVDGRQIVLDCEAGVVEAIHSCLVRYDLDQLDMAPEFCEALVEWWCAREAG